MDLKKNSTLTDTLEEIYEIGIDNTKFSEAEMEDAKVF